jgi:hypothetical protein
MQSFTVHVLEQRGLNSPVVQSALSLVQQIEGPVSFRYHEWTMPDAENPEAIDEQLKRVKGRYRFAKHWGFAKLQSEIDRIRETEEQIMTSEMYQSFSYSVPDPYSWVVEGTEDLKNRLDYITDDFYQATGADRSHSMVVIITHENNENNYFAVPDLFGKQWSFIQSNHPVTHLMAAPHLPVAYEMLAMPLRHFAFGDLPTFLDHLHIDESIGCMNDFYANLDEMERKLKSADICSRCVDRIKEVGVPYALLRQTRDGFEKIRVYQQNLANLLNEFELPCLELGYHLKVANTGTLIHLAPKELSVYAFFAEFPNGLPLSYVPDHTDRLRYWYMRFYTGTMDDPEAIERTVQRLANNTDNDLSQTISKLNKKIRTAMANLGSAEPYLILGKNGFEKKIAAARNELIRFAS